MSNSCSKIQSPNYGLYLVIPINKGDKVDSFFYRAYETLEKFFLIYSIIFELFDMSYRVFLNLDVHILPNNLDEVFSYIYLTDKFMFASYPTIEMKLTAIYI